MTRPLPTTRADYPHFLAIPTRWSDNDVYGHVNNVVYFSFFDTAVNQLLLDAGTLDIENSAVIALVVESQCRYFAPVLWATKGRLMSMDPKRYIEVMSNWQKQFEAGANLPVMGVTEAELRSIAVPTVVIPGNDQTHNSESGRTAQRLIPGSVLHQLPIEDHEVPLIPFPDWAPYEDEIVRVYVELMRRVEAGGTRAKQAVAS